MSTLDLLLVLPIAYGTYKGFKKGLVVEVVRTLGLVGGIAGAIMLLDLGKLFLEPYFQDSLEPLLPFAAFALIFMGIWMASRTVGAWARNTLRYTLLGNLDKTAGATVGLLKMTFLVSTLLWAVNMLGIHIPHEHTEGTFVYPVVQEMGPRSYRIAGRLLPFVQEWGHTLREAIA